MYKYLNSTLTAVVHLPTSRCIYLDQPSTIHTENFIKWRDGWTETIPEKRTVTTPASTTVKPAWIEKVGGTEPPEYIEHPEETIVVDEVVEITPEQTINHLPNTPEPYVPPVVVPPTPQQIREKAKAEREVSVSQIKVTTQAGNEFDGDEISQGRMARAIIALNTGLAPSVTWVLANNTTIAATKEELTEALVLAGQAQAAIWVI